MYTAFWESFLNMYAGMAVALAMYFGGMFITFLGLKIQSMGELFPMFLGAVLTCMGGSIFMVGVVNLIC